ncbi:SIR2 family protein [Lactiplantibacillus pentosus]|uniref:SIR2 family protein n=1 Tax=Lactiplantibacillus pentosus TaxID=1589 RepID=UPI00270F9A1F|nr:SIR2 family protein [Lactiplantibacillus pentosus]MDO7803783.1 SIR2 family protein [Lactiplantibacillus pentosus]
MGKIDNTVATVFRNLAITKQLNFLLGSGTSLPAIPLMGNLTNEDLLNKVCSISQDILKDKSENESVNYTQNIYNNFIQTIIDLLNLSNSRQAPKNINIFTTNYDLFVEKAIDNVAQNNRFVFNDGASGYFQKILDSTNYNRTVSYRGLNNNYLNEMPSISLIKPHGSVNWIRKNEDIRILTEVSSKPVIVPPTGFEAEETFLQNHFYEMLRIFQLELDKPQSVLFVIGFSFQDKHIGKMVKRALQNPELIVYVFGYSNDDREKILSNLDLKKERMNFRIVTPKDISNKVDLNITLNCLTSVLSGTFTEESLDDDE